MLTFTGGAPRDYLFDLAIGRIPGARPVYATGGNADVDITSVPEDIWNAGGAYPLPTAAAALEVVSSSANDAAAGTGLRTMLVQGLDSNYAEIQETVTLNGTSAVALSNQYLRLNAAIILSAGSGNVNAGTITLRESGGGTTRGSIAAGYGLMRQCVYTVPAGYSMAVIQADLSVVTPTTAYVTMVGKATAPSGYYYQTLELTVTTEHVHVPILAPQLIPETWTFGIRVTGTSHDNTSVAAGFVGVLIDNDYL